jgi:hypothetical protein
MLLLRQIASTRFLGSREIDATFSGERVNRDKEAHADSYRFVVTKSYAGAIAIENQLRDGLNLS